ncbi:hypothetical protein ACF053_27375 [Streptomyces kanasensis]|uniref:hypothetical protein n=1 Tax=Streptomyces kanasensis TaxID=936756 RepID=UPI0036FDA57E
MNDTIDEHFILHRHGSGADALSGERTAALVPGGYWSSENVAIGMYEACPDD